MEFEAKLGYPVCWDDLRAYTREHDPVGQELGEYPDPEVMSALCFRRLRHDWTNYDAIMDSTGGDEKLFKTVAEWAQRRYPEMSTMVIRHWLTSKRKWTTPRSRESFSPEKLDTA